MGKLLFVTGTDTSVGKTVFSVQLVIALREMGMRVAALKPLASGCAEDPAGEDGFLLWQALGGKGAFESVALYRFAAPLAPTVAARLEGVAIDRELIRKTIAARADESDWVIVEGAGGLLSPLDGEWTLADLASECGAALVVVVGSKLGAINHACLTFEVAQSRQIPVVGYVVNEGVAGPVSDKQLLETNRALLREVATRYDVGELGRVAFISDIERAASADTVRRLIESFPR